MSVVETIGAVAGALKKPFDIVDQLVTDKDKAAELKQEIEKIAYTNVANILVADAQGNWLQRSWRPVIMLVFTMLIVAHWFGFTAQNLTEDMVLSLLSIIQVCMGVYFAGRTVEKTAKTISPKIQWNGPRKGAQE
jgi:hypothetical protein